MLSVSYLRLHLADPARNRARTYELEVDEDLLGDSPCSAIAGTAGRVASLRPVGAVV